MRPARRPLAQRVQTAVSLGLRALLWASLMLPALAGRGSPGMMHHVAEYYRQTITGGLLEGGHRYLALNVLYLGKLVNVCLLMAVGANMIPGLGVLLMALRTWARASFIAACFAVDRRLSLLMLISTLAEIEGYAVLAEVALLASASLWVRRQFDVRVGAERALYVLVIIYISSIAEWLVMQGLRG